ncbi:MAG: methylmalonyl-CoA mutase, partial [Acidimicrobiia bacterium]|nr:methylmalonyl-CoA mutase [Acidimicrobiia bacterium]
QTAGSTLTAQQPENNIVRTALQAMSAVLGGTQSLHTNSYDEALGLPTEESALIALRTQQIIAEETGAADTIDPFAGSWHIEALTDSIEAEAMAIIDDLEAAGGAVAAEAAGLPQQAIEDAAYDTARRLESGEEVIVGVNRFASDDSSGDIPVLKVDPTIEASQVEQLASWKANRDGEAVASGLAAVTDTARGTSNLLYPMREALRVGCTVGEVSSALVEVFGRHRPT